MKPIANNDAETKILSAFLTDNTLEDFIDILSPDDFTGIKNKTVFNAMVSLKRDGSKVSHQTVGTKPEVVENQYASYVFSLFDYPGSVNIKQDISTVKALTNARMISKIFSKFVNEPGLTQNPLECIERFRSNVVDVDTISFEKKYKWMAETIDDSVEFYENLRTPEGQDDIVYTGFKMLDTLIGGIHGGKFIVLAGRPSMGKTAFMLCLIRNMMNMGKKVGVFSLEMDRVELDLRFLSIETRINSMKINSPAPLTKQEYQRIHDAADIMSDWGLATDESGELPVDELCRRCRQMKKDGIQAIFIDQFQELSSPEGETERARFSEIVRKVNGLKKELKIPIFLLAQFNRKLEDRAKKEPQKGDLKNTGDLEEKADIILGLHREHVFDKAADENHTKLLIIKARGASASYVDLYWEPKLTLFTENANSF